MLSDAAGIIGPNPEPGPAEDIIVEPVVAVTAEAVGVPGTLGAITAVTAPTLPFFIMTDTVDEDPGVGRLHFTELFGLMVFNPRYLIA